MSPSKSGGERYDRLVTGAQDYMTRAWGSQRESLHRAHRYSAFVRIMKRALPLAAVALFVAVLAYALKPRELGRVTMTFERMGTIEDDLAMVNPRLTGTDNQGMPFTVSAASAVQEGRAAENVRLKDIRAEMSLADGSLLHVTAADGLIDTRAGQMNVSGGIRFISADGYVAETATAKADFKTGTVSGTSAVTATSKFGRLTANSFTFDRESKTLRFDGQVRMLVNGATR